jgi:hypothetical protein
MNSTQESRKKKDYYRSVNNVLSQKLFVKHNVLLYNIFCGANHKQLGGEGDTSRIPFIGQWKTTFIREMTENH